MLNHIKERANSILAENGFSEHGICQELKVEYADEQPATILREQIAAAIDRCRQQDKDIGADILSNPVPYEDPERITNVAIDDVNVKKQEENRPGGRKPERGERIRF